MLYDSNDPTTALFTSRKGAAKAGDMVMAQHRAKITRTEVKPRRCRGELLGYALVIHFKDKRPASPLTNSDFERLN